MQDMADAGALADRVAKDKADLIELLDTSRQRMNEVIQKIDLQQEVYPHWTLKHFLAHLTGWDDALVVSLRAYIGGNEPGTPAYRGIDSYNEQTVAEREPLDYEHIVAEWNLTRQQLRAAVQDMPVDKMYEPLVYPWGENGTLRTLIRTMAGHEIEHADELEKLITPPPPQAAPDQPALTAEKEKPDVSVAANDDVPVTKAPGVAD